MRLFRSDEGEDVRIEIDYAAAKGLWARQEKREIVQNGERERESLFPL